MGYFACHSNYIISVLGCTKCNESRDEGTQPGPWEHKRISKKAPRLELYNQNLPLQKKQVGNNLSVSGEIAKCFLPPLQILSVLVEAGAAGCPPRKAATLAGDTVFHRQILEQGQLRVWQSTYQGVTGPSRTIVGHSLRTGIAVSKLGKCHIIRGCRRYWWDSKVQPEDIC